MRQCLTKILVRCSFVVFIPAIFLISIACQQRINVDILITGAMVFDGNYTASQPLEVGITGDRIRYVSNKGDKNIQAKKTIDATGLYLAPGFIDPHTHVEGELSAEATKANLRYLRQGVTTVFAGNDGRSPMPIGQRLEEWDENGIGTNAALLVGHGSVREAVMGMEAEEADERQLQAMEQMVDEAMQEGAFGISTGLFYAPGSFANLEEVVALSRIVNSYGGIYDTHLRDEGSYNIGLIHSVKEAISVGALSGIGVHISHIKCLGTDVWGKSSDVIAMIKKARDKGIQVSANQYPYLASRTSLKSALVPRWAEDGGFEKMISRFEDPKIKDSLKMGILENLRKRGGVESLILSDARDTGMIGKSLGELAIEMGMNAENVVMEILKKDGGIKVISFNMHADDLERYMQQPWVMTGSDGGAGHPRQFGTFPRKMHKYTLEENVIDLPFMIHSSSGMTAQTFKVKDRGFVKEGFFADLIVFDLEKVKDLATFDEPYNEATGMVYVLVNGQIVIEQEAFTGKLAGRSLRLIENE